MPQLRHFQEGKMPGDVKKYQDLYQELVKYERNGIKMTMDGMPASPMQIAAAHMVKEETAYMRDYITDDKGYIKELSFYRL